MAKNHLEELVAQLWRLKGYVVMENVNLFLSSGEERQVGGHSDADVIALKDCEVVHIECQTNWVPGRPERNSQHQRLFIGKEESFVVRTLIELIRKGMINLQGDKK